MIMRRNFFPLYTLLSCFSCFFFLPSTAFMIGAPKSLLTMAPTTARSSKKNLVPATSRLGTLLLHLSSTTNINDNTSSSKNNALNIILFGIGDLRTIDHGGLTNALRLSKNSKILPLVILDTKETLSNMPMGRTHTYDNASILHASLVSLQSNLKSKYDLDLHVCLDDDSSSTSNNNSTGDKKGVMECVKDVIEQCTKENGPDSTFEEVVIHSCDLGDVDNQLGYGPYGYIEEGDGIRLEGWNCHLRNEPWDVLSSSSSSSSSSSIRDMSDFPSTFTDYEKKYIRNKNSLSPLETEKVVPSSSSSSSTPMSIEIPSMMNTPSIDDISNLLCKSLDMDKDTIPSTANTGLYATHWGGLDIPSTLNEDCIVDVIDTFLGSEYEDSRGDNALVDKFKWWNVAGLDSNNCKLKRNPQSLEHATMNWLMTGGIDNPNKVKTENLIEAELLTRYLAAPLLFGMVSSRYMWNQAEKINQKNESPFDFYASYRSSTNAMKSIVENREWHQLFAAKNLRLEGEEEKQSGSSSSSLSVKVAYEYLRWHGFLCRYASKSINSSKNESTNDNDKEGIVLVHGFGASGSQWEKTIDELEKSMDDKKYRNVEAFAPDLIGFGQCEKPSFTYTQYLWEGYTADCVKDVGLGKRQWSKFAIGGNSIGGYTAMGAAADDSIIDGGASCNGSDKVSALGAKGSGKCQGLVLMNSAGRILSQEEIDEAERTVAESTARDMLGLSSPPPRGIARVGGNGLLAYLRPRIQSICVNLYPTNPDAVDDKLCGGILRDSLDPGAINVMISGSKLPPPRTANELLGADFGSSKSRQAMQFSSSVQEASFDGPVLVAQGILDPLNDARGRANMLEGLRSGITVNRMDGGHCPHDELPEMTAKNIVNWMETSVWTEAK